MDPGRMGWYWSLQTARRDWWCLALSYLQSVPLSLLPHFPLLTVHWGSKMGRNKNVCNDGDMQLPISFSLLMRVARDLGILCPGSALHAPLSPKRMVCWGLHTSHQNPIWLRRSQPDQGPVPSYPGMPSEGAPYWREPKRSRPDLNTRRSELIFLKLSHASLLLRCINWS